MGNALQDELNSMHVNDRMIDEFMAKFGCERKDDLDVYENPDRGYEVPGDFASEMCKYEILIRSLIGETLDIIEAEFQELKYGDGR